MKIYQKLLNIQKAHLSVSKDAKNPFFKSKYVTLDNLVSTLTPLLDKQELLVFHKTEDGSVKTVVADAESGETIESCFPMPQLNDPQKIGSVISYAKRYNLAQLFNIITDRDDDGEEARAEVSKKPFGKENFENFQKTLTTKPDRKKVELSLEQYDIPAVYLPKIGTLIKETYE